MSKVYLLCKEDTSGNIEYVLNVFSDRTQAIKELYKNVGFYKERDIYDADDDIDYMKEHIGKFNWDNSYFILIKTVDKEEFEEDFEHVYDLKAVKNVITENIWQKVIDELPEKQTLKKLISFENQMREYNKQVKEVAEEIKKKFSVQKEVKKKLDEININIPTLQID